MPNSERAGPPLNRREHARQQTRRRLIAAARIVLAQRGYEDATLRDVAALTGVSTGAVFANFSDKADLFGVVVAADQAGLLDRMLGESVGPGATEETLLDMLCAGFAGYVDQYALVRAQMAFVWSLRPDPEKACRAGERRIVACLADVLRRGVLRGDLAADIDAGLIAEMLWEGCLADYRHGPGGGWTSAALRARQAARIGVLLGVYKVPRGEAQSRAAAPNSPSRNPRSCSSPRRTRDLAVPSGTPRCSASSSCV